MTQNGVDAQTSESLETFFSNAVKTASGELLSAIKPEFQPAELAAEDSEFTSAGVVGFLGTNIRGVFFVGVVGNQIEAMREELHDDWVGELANQIAGRVKNRLCRVGVSYESTPPITLRSTRLGVATMGAQSSLSYKCPTGVCRVWALLDVLEPIELTPEPETSDAISEGDLVLF